MLASRYRLKSVDYWVQRIPGWNGSGGVFRCMGSCPYTLVGKRFLACDLTGASFAGCRKTTQTLFMICSSPIGNAWRLFRARVATLDSTLFDRADPKKLRIARTAEGWVTPLVAMISCAGAVVLVGLFRGSSTVRPLVDGGETALSAPEQPFWVGPLLLFSPPEPAPCPCC